MAARLIDDVFDALDEQTVVVPGTGTLDVVIPSLARSLAAVHEQRRALEAQIKALLEEHPLSKVLTSMPGVAVMTAAVLLVTVGDATSFPSAAHLASYAGLAPTTKSSGTSIHGERAPRGGKRQLKRAMFLSAFAALHDPAPPHLLLRPMPGPHNPHAGPSPSGPPPHQRAVRHALRRHLLRTPHPRNRPPHDLLILDERHRGPPATRLSRGHPTRQQPRRAVSAALRHCGDASRVPMPPRQIMKSTFTSQAINPAT
ncbi:hypothetical protein GCM10020295_57310 [Streptomyces cinereospinus]